MISSLPIGIEGMEHQIKTTAECSIDAMPRGLVKLCLDFMKGKLFSPNLYKIHGTVPVEERSNFHNDMMKNTDLSAQPGKTIYGSYSPYLATDTRVGQKFLILTVDEDTYVAMRVVKKASRVYFNRDKIGHPTFKIRPIPPAAITKYHLNNMQPAINEILTTIKFIPNDN